MKINSSRKSDEKIKKPVTNLEEPISWLKSILPKSVKKYNNTTMLVKQISSNIESGSFTHAGLINYLYYCWSNEKGCCLRPDMLWYRVIAQTCSTIMESPDKFKHLFTSNNNNNNNNKQDILMEYNHPYELNCDLLDKMLDEHVLDKKFKDLVINTSFKSQPENFMLALRKCALQT